MTNKSIIASLLFMFVSSIAFAQVPVTFAANFQSNAPLTTDQRRIIETALTQKLSDYIKYAKLLNPESRRIDRASVNNFKELFTLDAKLFNDMREIPEAFLYPVEGYVRNVRNYFSLDGLMFGINTAEIKKVEYNEYTARYTAIVKISKSVERYYKEDGTVENGTKAYDLEFLYTFKINELDNARIMTIRRDRESDPGEADVYTKIFNLGVGAAIGLPSFSETTIYKDIVSPGTVDLEPQTEFSLGFTWYSNFLSSKTSTSKKLFFAGGATVFLQDIVGVLKDYSTSGTIPVQGQIPEDPNPPLIENIDRKASNVQVEEIQSIIGVRVPIGLSLRLLNKNTSSAFINVQYAPSLIISSSGEYASNSKGNYHLNINDEFISFATDESQAYDPSSPFSQIYEIGNDKAIESKPELSPTFNHGILISGLFLKDLVDDNPTYGIGIGLHFYMPFTDPWKNNTTQDKPFLYPDKSEYTEPGVISPFMESIQLSHVGLSVNVYFKRNRQP